MSLLRLAPGTVFAGDFEIVSPLAEGGMGAVYVARQLSTGKERALKVMQPQFITDSRNRERFGREARAGSQVESEHVVEVVAAGIDAQTNVPWIAMELLRGEDLESFAARVGPLAPIQTLEIFRQLCHGLAAAHVSGLVHRDLKPENVFLATARHVGVPFTVKLLDFGIAKMVQETKHDVTDAVGTPTWMAPEQTESGRSITPATDVWALGLIAFRLLTGVKYWKASQPDDASPMAILREVVFEPMEPASVRARALGSKAALSAAFDGWFSRCLSRDASKRFPNATATLAALEPILAKGLDAPSGSLVAPLERAPATIRGEPFGTPRLVSATDTFREHDPLPATRVGPFTGPADTERAPKTSAPPAEDRRRRRLGAPAAGRRRSAVQRRRSRTEQPSPRGQRAPLRRKDPRPDRPAHRRRAQRSRFLPHDGAQGESFCAALVSRAAEHRAVHFRVPRRSGRAVREVLRRTSRARPRDPGAQARSG
jgi:serine/threonine protein kinase